MQRRARSGIDPDIIQLHAFLIGEEFLDLVGLAVQIPAAVRRNLVHRFERLFAGAQRIFIGVDHDGVGRHIVDLRKLRHCRLVIERERRPGSQHSCQPSKRSPRKTTFQKLFLFLYGKCHHGLLVRVDRRQRCAGRANTRERKAARREKVLVGFLQTWRRRVTGAIGLPIRQTENQFSQRYGMTDEFTIPQRRR